jgi:hypothetical protein
MATGSEIVATGRIRLTRPSAFWAVVRAFQVLIDGQFVGTIYSGGVFEVDIAPGHHEVTVEITTLGTTMQGSRSVSIAAEEMLYLEASIKTTKISWWTQKSEIVVTEL